MALVVGELTAVLSVDDRAVDPGLRRAENALRASGRDMGDAADQAGQDAGRQLGEGLVRGADGQWRNMRGDLVDAVTAAAADAESAARRVGQRVGDRFGDALDDQATQAARQAGDDAGEALGDGLGDSGGAGAEEAVGGIGEKLGALKMAAAGVGAAAGAMLMAAFTEALDQGRIVGRLGAQLGATPAEAQRYGKLAGELYADAITEDFQGAADTIQTVMRAGLLPPDATNAQVESISTRLADVANLLEEDVGQAARTVGKMIKTGLADNATEALDILTRGVQTGANEAEDLLDTFTEYSTQFRDMGLTGEQAMGLISQGLKGGARDADVVADSIKEFSIEAVRGGDTVKKGFESLGLSADDMVKKFAAGGPEAAGALDTVLDKLRGIEDPAKRNAVALELFGTKAEDMGAALYSLDPSEAVKALGDVEGAADGAGNALRDNASTRVTQFQRGMQQGLVDFLGGTVIPGLETFRSYVTGRFGSMWTEAAAKADSGALVDKLVAFFPILGQRMWEKAQELAPRMIEGIIAAGQRVGEWVMANPTQVFKVGLIAAAITLAIVSLPLLVGAALIATAGLLIWSFVGGLISKLGEYLPQWWASFQGWIYGKVGAVATTMVSWGGAIGTFFSGLWSRYVSGPVGRFGTSFLNYVRGIPARTVVALAALGAQLASAASTHWQRFKDGSANKVSALVTWVRGIPNRISSGVGNLGSLLFGKGQDVVRGLLRGVQSMGGYLRSQLMSFARSMIPGPIAKALGIASPSKVMAKSVGRWIPRGIVAGIESTAGEVDRTMAGLVSTPTPSMTMQAGVAGATGSGTANGGSGSQGTVTLRADDALTDGLMNLIRRRVGISGGDVQVVLGPRGR